MTLSNGRTGAGEYTFPAGAAAHNLRDFGGYPTASGARLIPGRLFRSGQLETASARLPRILVDLGVATIIDLRAGSECNVARGTAFDGYAGAIRQATAHDETIPHAVAAFVNMTQVEEVIAHMTRIYRILPTSPRFQESMGHLVESLARDDGATLIHCFAGKDRTGLAVALVQLSLGVHRDDVFHDYLLTNQMGPERITAALDALLEDGIAQAPEAILNEAMAVRAEYLEAGLRRIEEISGSPAAYLAKAAGLDVAEIGRIGERLLA